MTIPFTKAHGAKNDFLLSWREAVGEIDLNRAAIAICDRHTGVGADGWITVEAVHGGGIHARIRLFNRDGSEGEISGNGTRCAAALLVDAGHQEEDIYIETGAGVKHLRLLGRDGQKYLFEMDMGRAVVAPDHLRDTMVIDGASWDVTIIDVGNPQCAVFPADFAFDWRRLGAVLEVHPRFPNRTNVSFVRAVGPQAIEVLFFERGVGETMSSGTGSTGAAMAAYYRGLVQAPIEVRTPAGPLMVRLEKDRPFLTGPAEIIASGDFHY